MKATRKARRGKKLLRGKKSFEGDIVVHIGKTGGSYLRGVLASLAADPARVRPFGHSMTVPKAMRTFPNCSVVFAIREPLSLFVSGFNTRLRQGKPMYDKPWSETDKIAFRMFGTPNALAEALDSDDASLKACAEFAMHTIFHVNRSLAHYLRSAGYLRKVQRRIAFILEQSTLDEDIAEYVKRLGLETEKVRVLRDTLRRHETPAGHEVVLSARARKNLQTWYADDIEAYAWCLAHKSRINAR